MRKPPANNLSDVESMHFLRAVVRLADAAAVKRVARLRARHPDEDADALARRTRAAYLAAVTTSGAAAGATAFAPGVGTIAAFASVGAEKSWFVLASAVHVLTVLRLHGVDAEDPARAREMVLAAFEGAARVRDAESGRAGTDDSTGTGTEDPAPEAAAARARGPQRDGRERSGRTAAGGLGSTLAGAVSRRAVDRIGRSVGGRFAATWGSRKGLMAAGRAAPFGLGALLSGGTNLALAQAVLRATDGLADELRRT